jgi:outer membrane protein TolC
MALAAAMLAACTVGPDYRAPRTDSPAAWRVEPNDSYWRPAKPGHAPLDSQWWKIFGIGELDMLETEVLANSQTVFIASVRT